MRPRWARRAASLTGQPELQETSRKSREKWAREHSTSLRRDCISSLSESLNGAVKKGLAVRTQVVLARALVKQSRGPT